MQVEGALFKLNDVVIDETATTRRALCETARRVLGEESPDEQQRFSDLVYKGLFGKNSPTSFRTYKPFMDRTEQCGRGSREMLLLGRTEIPELANTLPDYRKRFWQEAEAEFYAGKPGGSAPPVSRAADLQNVAIQERWNPKNVVQMPGVRDLFHSLKNQGAQIGILSNGLSWQREIVEHSGVADMVDHVVVSGEGGHGASEKTIVHDAVNELGRPVKQVMFVGNQDKDISAANKIGIERAFWYRADQGAAKRELASRDLAKYSDPRTTAMTHYAAVSEHAQITDILEGRSPEPSFKPERPSRSSPPMQLG